MVMCGRCYSQEEDGPGNGPIALACFAVLSEAE